MIDDILLAEFYEGNLIGYKQYEEVCSFSPTKKNW